MKKIFSMLAILVVIIALVGCSMDKETSSTTNATKSSHDGSLKVGLSMNTLNNPFFVAVKEGAEAQAKEKGVELVVTDAQNDPGKQLADVENLLQQNIDILIIDPADSDAIAEAVRKANDAKIPVFTIDRQSNGGKVVTHIGFDAIKSGRIAGNFLKKALNGKGKIVEIQGILGTNVAQLRSKGFNEIMEQTPGFEVVARQSANFDRGQALKVMEDILQAHPEIDGVYAANDEMALGALAAIEAAGRLDEIVVIGCDAVDPALEAIRQGKLEATIAEPPFFLGKEAINTALKISKGEKVEKEVILESTLVTRENVDQVKTK
ncbi:substrate-binding domain-containing protein [Saccharococcus caldoxylosilyticus]|uniref:substrate-binding domain-containing protein n=1 Tax=Saccharococcus caldoxylosilyticus TaxID=81408 RepID=UPI001FCBDFBC|nr:substrate-binding domain-containing protein [Parageobacillus caldoxylosilyticus]BDG36359.1 D-ribose ABC transporter substrate-binding protein [Parageobacillus caldoxylosilyticus]BDG40146.1 D-ribose ABC transporter substrate-binding protein [Parageobacillus caldoxylosilyticus]BDG43872.1 D-ribose ABC transporter substrate-binding protein [Parageobacillus caldoxylosilyticus]